MKKRVYAKPILESETFIPQTYCKVCANDGIHVKYLFECNAGDRRGGYSVYLNGPDGIAHTKDDIFWCGGRDAVRGNRTYGKCGETHEAEDNNDFFPGYITKKGSSAINVIVWTANGTNTHCTTKLNKDEWDTAKS